MSVRIFARRGILGGVLTLSVLIIVGGAIGSVAQTKTPRPVTQSELARQNMERVAANVTEIIAVLHKDHGIMVELKAWVAKDATDHGQIVSDADLTDQSIYDRLENDVTFRSAATRIVQKYGYLQPTVNPDSPMAKEQELLMQERVKWIAQDADAQRQKAMQAEEQRVLKTQANCDPRISVCAPQTGSNPSIQGLPQSDETNPIEGPGFQNGQPSTPAVPYSPQEPGPSNNVPLLRTQGEGSSSYEQTQFGSNSYQQGSDEQEGEESSRMGTRGLQGQRQGTGNDLDFSQSEYGDFGQGSYSGTEMYGSNPYASTGLSSTGMNGGTYSSNRTSIYDLSLDPIAQMNARRERQALTPSQKMVRKPNPFENVPSLYDMYLQAAARPPAVQRFGMQIFENGTRDLQMIPTDLPVGPEYVLGPGDAVSVDLWGGVSRRFYRVIDRQGRLTLPEVGPVLVAGKSLADVQTDLQKTMRTQLRDISVDISLSRLRTIRVYVVGDVLRPGAYDIGSLSTPLNALFAAGGPTGRGSLRNLKHYRGNTLVQDVDVYDLLLHGIRGDVQRLENGDTVMVPPLGPQITIDGMVRRPAIYETKDEKSLADVIALAGGLLPTATLRHVEVQRTVAHEKKTMLSVDIPADGSTAEVSKKLESFQIQDLDKIRIFPIASYAANAVYLEGHVIRPGKYSYKPGMKVTDLVSSYKDLLPDPALQYGEIVRLSEPDFHPTVQSFSVAAALADPAHAPELQPLDTVEFFGRYDFEDPPIVSVWGDVRDPGTYRTSGDIHISDAIHLAGGLGADAFDGDAQVFRYQSDSTMKILNVKLSGALDGNPNDDIVLHPRDRVLVHRNAAAIEPSSVYVKGEVGRPGRYPLTVDMRVSDLIHAAGGLKQSADVKTADLTHYTWENEKQVMGTQDKIVLADALEGKPEANAVLNNGDVLTIAQVAGWNDIGASITLRGEVVHPGTYGIRPGERLSSVIERAGGFAPAAYPYATILLRADVQKIEQRSYGELIQRVREQQATLKLTATNTGDPDQKVSAESALVQWQTTLDSLLNAPPQGRVTIQISSNIKSWTNTPRDIVVRSGDVVTVPKRPSFILVQGQVYGPTAVAYRPGKTAKWYLMQAGGPTNLAEKKAIFVIRADGTVFGHNSGWMSGDGLNVPLQPGDMVVVPEKAIGGTPAWRTVFATAQVVSSLAISALVIATYVH
ncbi:MAG TPA: SLBB domain-containing protein [Candidatus Eisenbacteria bacterium]|nr:SLBB domain-containing protein [Candidatus Eisenbacteria bacterium]